MKNFKLKILCAMALTAVSMVSCNKNLNRQPTNGITSAEALSTAAGYKTLLAKVYASYGLTSSDGAGNTDLAGIDAGTSDFMRLFWNAQELSTDEAACVWNDPGVQDFHNMNWDSNNVILLGLYVRSLYQITVANTFISQASDGAIAKFSSADQTNIRYYRAEARFLRAYQYWVLMDLFGNPPFIDENSPIGGVAPPQKSRADVYAYVISELKAIDPLLVAPHKNEYGRADEAADWALQARVYLNAQVYTGTADWANAATYSEKVITAGYTLMTDYSHLFLADNNVNNPEVILSINYDGNNSQNYGGTTFILNSSINAAMNTSSFGVPNGGWAGNRSTQALPTLFTGTGESSDARNLFYSRGHTLNMDTLQSFTSGYSTTKWRNVNVAGVTAPSVNGTFSSIDFPLFRLGEMYLIHAEASEHIASGSGTADVNVVRARAGASALATASLQDILDERGRELYWEATRRTDLIRYGLFTGSNYLWAFKGGAKSGISVGSYRNLYPIPANDITANPNLKQNPGY